MTDGENMVWAAAFVKAREEWLECSHTDEASTREAVFAADAAVNSLRLRTGHGGSVDEMCSRSRS